MQVTGSVEGRHALGRKAAAKDKNRGRLEYVNVIPTDGMFKETEFSRPPPPGIPAEHGDLQPPFRSKTGGAHSRFSTFRRGAAA